MFLHLGGEIIVDKKNIIAILDMKSTLGSKDTKNFLTICEEEGFIKNVSEEESRSFVIVEEIENKNKSNKGINKTIIYKSPISALTLQKRARFI